MTALYLWDKRYLPDHPQHGLYTGLKELYERQHSVQVAQHKNRATKNWASQR